MWCPFAPSFDTFFANIFDIFSGALWTIYEKQLTLLPPVFFLNIFIDIPLGDWLFFFSANGLNPPFMRLFKVSFMFFFGYKKTLLQGISPLRQGFSFFWVFFLGLLLGLLARCSFVRQD